MPLKLLTSLVKLRDKRRIIIAVAVVLVLIHAISAMPGAKHRLGSKGQNVSVIRLSNQDTIKTFIDQARLSQGSGSV